MVGGDPSRIGRSGPSRVRLADAGRTSNPIVMSDANPDPIRPGARYATTLPALNPNALVGDPQIVSTTVRLNEILAHVMDVVEPGSDALTPQEYGRLVHERFVDTVRILGLPGIGYDDVETTFGGAYYGAKDSVRTDVVLRDEAGKVIAIYDVKTGMAEMRPARAAELRVKVGVDNSVPIYQLHILHGVLRKAFARSACAAYVADTNL
jgi:hypothetical protein